MTDNTRCEPPEHLRGVDGWHWLELHGMTQPAPYRWQNEGIWCGLERDGGAVRPLWAAKLGYRYHAPAASPEVVRGLVEALDFYACVDHYPVHHAVAPEVVRNDGGGKARAALALYRGEVA